VLLRDRGITALCDLCEPVALPREAVITRPVVGRDVRTGLHRVQHEAFQRFCRAVKSDLEAEAPGIEPTPTREGLAGIALPLVRLALARLDRSHYQRLMVLSPALAARPAPNPSFVDLDREHPSDTVAIGAHHRPTEFVQNLESCFVALQAQLPLELHCTHTWRLARHEGRSPKPDRDRCVRPLHDRVGSK